MAGMASEKIKVISEVICAFAVFAIKNTDTNSSSTVKYVFRGGMMLMVMVIGIPGESFQLFNFILM